MAFTRASWTSQTTSTELLRLMNLFSSSGFCIEDTSAQF
jgi:hypothetical protein